MAITTIQGAFLDSTLDITSLVLSGASPLVFEGATADAYETTLAFVDPTADRVITIPNATDTLLGKATTDTLTNKTFDVDGTGNSLINIANSSIKAAAGIALNKLAATTVSRALVSDGSGFVSVSAVTATEIGYLDGVSSAIQTQLTAKAPIASPTFTTSITIGSATITEAELEILDGATVSTAELNLLDGVSGLVQADFTKLAAVDSTAVELNLLNGVSGLVQADLTKLAAVDSSAAELNLLDGVSGLVQADLTKLAAIDSTAAELNVLDALDRGSILYGNSSSVTTVLGQGAADTVLTSDGDDIAWQAPAASGLTVQQMWKFMPLGPEWTGAAT